MDAPEVTASITLVEDLPELELEALEELVETPHGDEDVTRPIPAQPLRCASLPPIPRLPGARLPPPPRLPTLLRSPAPERVAAPVRRVPPARLEPISVPPQLEWTKLVPAVTARRTRQRRSVVEGLAAGLSLLGLLVAGAAFALTLRDWSPTPTVTPASTSVAAALPASVPASVPSQAEPIASPEALPLESPQQQPRDVRSGATLLSLRSSPSSAVVVDGRPLGNTPVVVPVSPGSHSVLFVHPERGRVMERVVADAGRTRSVSARFAD